MIGVSGFDPEQSNFTHNTRFSAALPRSGKDAAMPKLNLNGKWQIDSHYAVVVVECVCEDFNFMWPRLS